MGRAGAGAVGPRQTPRGQGGGETGRARPPTPRRGPAPGRQKLTTLLDTGSPACGTRPTPGFGSIRFAPLRDSIRPDAIESPARPLAGGSPAGCDSIRFAPRPRFRAGAPRGEAAAGPGPAGPPGRRRLALRGGPPRPPPRPPRARGPSRAPPRGPRPAGAACPMRGDPRKTQPHTLGARGRGPHGARRGLRSAQRYLVEPARRAG